MSASVDWRESAYNKAYDDELIGLRRRREMESGLSVADLEGVLRHLYNIDGANWVGRGELQDIKLTAAIAAHEQFIQEWKAEKEKDTSTSE